MQLLINQMTNITSNPMRHFGGKITFQCGGVYNGASVALYQSLDGINWDLLNTFATANAAPFVIPWVNQAYYRASLTAAGASTNLTLSGG